MASWDPSNLDTFIDRYEQHLCRVKGLRDCTVQGYERLVRLFVRASLGEDPVDPQRLRPPDVTQFVISMRDRFSPGSMKTVRTALRSFLSFLRMEGLCDHQLEAAIPTEARWRLSTLPRCLSEEQLKQVLASLSRRRPGDLRDRAIVWCLATLGLRPGEVAALQLDDIDWRQGVIRLRTRKTGRGAVLPLPRVAGRAIVDYLRRGRPRTDQRSLFVLHIRSRIGSSISRGVVTGAAIRALRRAQIDTPIAGAYVFRHTLASRMVRRGASLKEVADLLGHRSFDTTTIYAKLDVPSLREVALPWPEVHP